MKALCDNTKDKEKIKVLKVTVDQVMSWEPCDDYTRERVEELFAGRESLSALEITELDIPAKDIMWAVLCEELLPAEILHKFACRCAEQALIREREAGREPDPCSWAAIKAKRKWLLGEITDGELAAARVAAESAARVAAEFAARAAVYDAAWVAAWLAAWNAAWNAADAANAAAWDAAMSAARSAQVAILQTLLREAEEA